MRGLGCHDSCATTDDPSKGLVMTQTTATAETPGSDPMSAATRAAAEIADRTGAEAHDVAVVLGSGWAGALDHLGADGQEHDLSSFTGFRAPSVAGHRDILRSIEIDRRHILVLGGRSHLYEGASAAEVVHGVRTAALAGCRAVMLTNAAGSLRPEWEPGEVVIISDHLNLTGASPVVGPSIGDTDRFCDMSNAYSARLRGVARLVDPTLPEGVYAALLGGNYETPAEIRMLRAAGADLVGMSTVLETIAARHMGLEVLGISLVTNLAAGVGEQLVSHAEVLETGRNAIDRVGVLIGGVLRNLWFGP